MIEGVVIKTLVVHPDGRGRLMEVMRCDDPFFERFGQVYVTTVFPGVVKGWHYHRHQTDHFAVARGTVKLVLYDRREDSPTHGELMELFPGVHRPLLVGIPPRVAHGFMGVGTDEAIVINVPDRPYDADNPDEFRIDPHQGDIPYDWTIRDR